jgi:F-type H+-transporting ATPase subunit delta
MPAFVARYAAAFADVVTDAKLDTAAIDRQLTDFLATWEASAPLREVFLNPAIAVTQKITILDKLNAKMGLEKQVRNLLAVLIRNDRIGHVSEVVAAYRRILQEQMGIHPAQITTARELSKEERETLTREVGKLAGGKVDASFTLDKAILGGTVVRIGSTVYDGSLRGRLERLKEELVSGQ